MTADQVKSYVASALVGELTQEQVEQIVAQVLASSDVDHATMTQVNEAISAATSGLVTSAQLSTATAGLITQDDLAAHQSDDLAMWQQVMDSASAQFAELKAGLAAVQASLQNKVLDTAGKVDIETEAQGVGYTVDATLGGQVTFTSPLALLAGVGTVWVNNVKVWTNVGLTLGVGLTSDTIEVVSGDVVATAGCTSVYFTPYKAA
jgi:hypothetical protein